MTQRFPGTHRTLSNIWALPANTIHDLAGPISGECTPSRAPFRGSFFLNKKLHPPNQLWTVLTIIITPTLLIHFSRRVWHASTCGQHHQEEIKSPRLGRQTSAREAELSNELLAHIESGDVHIVREFFNETHHGLQEALVIPSLSEEHHFRTPLMVRKALITHTSDTVHYVFNVRQRFENVPFVSVRHLGT